jgi:hypothetical protein
VKVSGSQGLSTVEITNDIFPGSSSYAPGPYGLGVRVPMIVVSVLSNQGTEEVEVIILDKYTGQTLKVDLEYAQR